MNVSTNFDIRELVHPDIWDAHGERSVHFIHPNLPITLEALKKNLHEVITVNDWHYGGNYKSSGLRSPDDIGARLSTHKFGGTGDTKYKHHTISEVFNHIIGNPEKYPYIIRIESIQHTPTWLHIEVGNERDGEIIVFNP